MVSDPHAWLPAPAFWQDVPALLPPRAHAAMLEAGRRVTRSARARVMEAGICIVAVELG